MKKQVVIFTLSLIFISAIRILSSCADEFGIGQFSANPQSFSPHKGETTTISGVVYYLSPEGNLSDPYITIKINEQLSLPVEVKLLSCEMLSEDSLTQLSEWSFSTAWDGRDERGEVLSPGDYAYTINLDLPNVGKDTKSGTITVNATE